MEKIDVNDIDIEEEGRKIKEKALELERNKSGIRGLTGKTAIALAIVAALFGLFHLYTGSFGMFSAIRQRSIHLGFALVIVFLKFSSAFSKSKKMQNTVKWYDYIFMAGSVISCGYIAINADSILARAGIVYPIDIVFGVIVTICVLEATRRCIGNVLTAIGIFVLLYCMYGYVFSGIFNHPGFSLRMVTRHMILTDSGLWSIPLGCTASYIAMFLLLGAAMHATGLAELLLKIATGIFGGMVGGPAKVAVMGSSMFAMISGSSSSNVATTGIITIPLMKKTGIKSEMAAAIEASSSMGGQITPPVMGAVAFIMAEFLGISYLTVITAAALPALLYYTGLFSMVHFECHKIGAVGLPKSELPEWKHDFFTKGYLFLPVFVLVGMLVSGYTPMMSSFVAFWLSIGLSFIRKETRMTLKKFFNILSNAGQTLTTIAIPSAIAGFVVGTATLTGLTPSLAGFVSMISQDSLIITLLITQVMCLVLGMGVPTEANYILMTIMTVPVIIAAGVPPLAAHFFCFYFGIMAELTPPVAITSYTASAIAGADFWKTAFNAVRLAAVSYVVPYFFVMNTGLLLGTEPFSLSVVWDTLVAIFGAVNFGIAMAGFVKYKLNIFQRLIIGIGSLMLIVPGYVTDIMGFAMIGVIILPILFVKAKVKLKVA